MHRHCKFMVKENNFGKKQRSKTFWRNHQTKVQRTEQVFTQASGLRRDWDSSCFGHLQPGTLPSVPFQTRLEPSSSGMKWLASPPFYFYVWSWITLTDASVHPPHTHTRSKISWISAEAVIPTSRRRAAQLDAGWIQFITSQEAILHTFVLADICVWGSWDKRNLCDGRMSVKS